MMEGYMVFQAMVYIVEYLPGLTFIKTELDRCIGDPNSTKKLEGEYLMGKGKAERNEDTVKEVDADAPRKLRHVGKGRLAYDVDGDDDEYFGRLERGELDERRKKEKDDVQAIGKDYQYKATCRSCFTFFILRFRVLM